jgi:hypothetical protein
VQHVVWVRHTFCTHTGAQTGLQGLQTGAHGVGQTGPQFALPMDGARQIAPNKAKAVKFFIFFLLFQNDVVLFFLLLPLILGRNI